LGCNISSSEKFQVIDCDIGPDNQRDVLPNATEVRGKYGEKTLRVMADSLIDADGQFDRLT
jgi:hypothetical protein